MKTRTHLGTLEGDVARSLATLRDCLEAPEGSPADQAMTAVEAFVDVALRVFKVTNHSKLRDCITTSEIKFRMDLADKAATKGGA